MVLHDRALSVGRPVPPRRVRSDGWGVAGIVGGALIILGCAVFFGVVLASIMSHDPDPRRWEFGSLTITVRWEVVVPIVVSLAIAGAGAAGLIAGELRHHRSQKHE